MKIKKNEQISVNALKSLELDLIICASGYEDRATHIASLVNVADIKCKVVLMFNDRVDAFSRKKNDVFFNEQKFDSITCDGDYEEEVIEYLEKFLTDCNKRNVNILVDYSCMTRIWYGAILKYFAFNRLQGVTVNVIFGYSMSKFVPGPETETFNIHIGPIRGFTSLTVPQKPTALIIGLGYEKNRAIGLNEYFDGETFLFFTDDSLEPLYTEEVVSKNVEILSSIKKKNVFAYPILDLEYTNSLLSSLCEDLSRNYRVIIAPCGPKPFTLLSLIAALTFQNIDVWRISSGKESVAVDKPAQGEVVFVSVAFG